MSKLLDEAKKNLEKVKREKQLANNSVSLHGLGGKGRAWQDVVKDCIV